jgi:aryl-alcohol dehydrogenase-like predicted oxidoreductase
MDTRTLGRTNRTVSVIGLGTWQLGADWGEVTEADARAVLAASVAAGVTLFDTADVYGDGRSERLIGGYLADNPGHGVTVATKMGRREAQDAANFTLAKFREWTDPAPTSASTLWTSCSCTARRPKSSRATGSTTTSTPS